jgi:EAL domain-containing protein (putative c-di-GMP-specific phosphodiesterase class I)
VYQPIHFFNDQQPSQFEALARFTDHQGQVIPNGIIFPMAERYHLSEDLDMIITQKIFSDLGKDWCRQNRLTVNLSIQSINDPEFHQWLDDIVSNHQQQAERLMIEISEQQYHGNSEQYIRFLDRFRPHGVHFSIDQFGINSTAFGFLQGLKLEQLKKSMAVTLASCTRTGTTSSFCARSPILHTTWRSKSWPILSKTKPS